MFLAPNRVENRRENGIPASWTSPSPEANNAGLEAPLRAAHLAVNLAYCEECTAVILCLERGK